MPRLSPEQWAAKLATRASAAGQDWLDGVKNPVRDPVQAALKAEPKYRAKMQESLQKGTWAKKMAKVDSAAMKATAERVGSGAYVQGITARADKIQAAGARILPKIYAVADKVAAMPDATDGDRDARMLANVKGLREIKGA
jgi:hypothetical protein